MSRAIVTPELSETLKNLRIEHKIQAKDLAAHVNKSRAFISRLENGTLQSIDSKDLYSILKFILGDEKDQDSLLDEIYSLLEFKYSQKEIREQLWFSNYDTVERHIPVPEALVKYFNQLINELGITHEYLLSRINANESLSEHEIEDSTIPNNQWYPKQNSNSQLDASIKICMSQKKLDRILSFEKDTTNYVTIMCILFYLYKIQQYKDRVIITDDEYKDLYFETIDTLNKYKFYSIAERRRLISTKGGTDDQYLSEFDVENRDIIAGINKCFRAISEFDIKQANKMLQIFYDNLNNDLGFMMALISKNYTDLTDVSVSNKRKLLTDIQELLSKYASLSDKENSIEMY